MSNKTQARVSWYFPSNISSSSQLLALACIADARKESTKGNINFQLKENIFFINKKGKVKTKGSVRVHSWNEVALLDEQYRIMLWTRHGNEWGNWPLKQRYLPGTKLNYFRPELKENGIDWKLKLIVCNYLMRSGEHAERDFEQLPMKVFNTDNQIEWNTNLYWMYNNFDGMGLCEGRRHSANYVKVAGEISAVDRCRMFVRFWLEVSFFVDAVASDVAAVDAGGAMVVDYSTVLWWEFPCLLQKKKRKKNAVNSHVQQMIENG